jgi:acylpyruvate hydrolase
VTGASWETGLGLGRVNVDGLPTVVLYRPGAPQAQIATVDGNTFADLPALLDAADGDQHRIVGGADVSLTETDLLSPVARPRKIVCMGQNYVEHVREGGREAPPAYPDLFPKWDNALNGPYSDIELPMESDQIDYESELAVVIGRRCRRVAEADVHKVVFGYTAANDGSVRDYQFRTSQRTAGKVWDGLTPLGPVVVPADQLGGVTPDLRLTGRLNGELMQDDRTSRMVFGIAPVVSYITEMMTLEPGDVILTGTPAGVGLVRQPPRLLCDGDEFEVSIEGIGSIRNRFVAEKPN